MSSSKQFVCQLDQRRFSTKAALAQHRRSVHSGPSTGAARRKRQVAVRNMGTAGVITSSGVDVLPTLSIAANQQVGRKLMMQPISPVLMADTRIYAESRLWNRWRPVSMQVAVNCSGASTTFGSICVGWTSDPYFRLSGDARDFSRVAALKPSMVLRLHESRTLSIPCDAVRRWYVHSGDFGDCQHGALIAVVASPVGGFDKGSIGVTMTLRWKLQFEAPNLSLESQASHSIRPDAGWHDIFATSDSSWDSGYLTFKERSGGSMVPFSAARAGYIYEPDAGVSVKYYDSSGALHDAKFFTRVQNYATPGLVLHASAADAKAYIEDGTLSKVLPYAKAGPYVTPSVPSFKGSPAEGKVEEDFVLLPTPSTSGSGEDRIRQLSEMVERLRVQVEVMSAAR
uniref:Putative CP n=1 Tax=Neohydatothrips associated sobemo-like virus 1 TaxID=2767261 RepID=A0A7G9IR94_9VIRU|nr:putative CP [Neohydatothrips associated sobemo-like virus 1]